MSQMQRRFMLSGGGSVRRESGVPSGCWALSREWADHHARPRAVRGRQHRPPRRRPARVFVLDSKAWSGVVTVDQDGATVTPRDDPRGRVACRRATPCSRPHGRPGDPRTRRRDRDDRSGRAQRGGRVGRTLSATGRHQRGSHLRGRRTSARLAARSACMPQPDSAGRREQPTRPAFWGTRPARCDQGWPPVRRGCLLPAV
jgi:hypothetical protein